NKRPGRGTSAPRHCPSPGPAGPRPPRPFEIPFGHLIPGNRIMTPVQDSELNRLDEQVTTCLRQGRFAQALPLAARVCEEVRGRAGEKSPELACSFSRLAETHRELGHLSQAEAWCFKALEIREAAGKDRPEYAASLNDLARLYEAVGNNRQAETFY